MFNERKMQGTVCLQELLQISKAGGAMKVTSAVTGALGANIGGEAAAVGCCAQMVGFSAVGYRDCKMGGVMAMGLGSSMFQFPNILKNPWILLPPTLSSMLIAPIATCLLKTTNTPAGAGMGTCGFVGQIFTFTDMGINARSVISVVVLHIMFPVCLSLLFDRILRKKGKIKAGDYYFEL